MSIEVDQHAEFVDVVATVMAESTNNDVTTLTNVNDSYTSLKSEYDETPQKLAKIVKIRKYQLHTKTYSPKWEKDPNYRGWVSRSKKGDGFYYCLACNQDYTCGKSELDKHASSRKHCMNVINLAKSNSDQYSLAYGSDLSAYEVQTVKCDPLESGVATVLHTDFDASYSASSSTSGSLQVCFNFRCL